MHNKDKQRLRKLCRLHNIDEALIDSSISFEENVELLKLEEVDPHHGEPEIRFFEDYCSSKLYDRCFGTSNATQHSTSLRSVAQRSTARFSLEKYVASRKRG